MAPGDAVTGTMTLTDTSTNTWKVEANKVRRPHFMILYDTL
jgi:hypothetical protein